jgi:hypothetical protein
MTTPKSAVNRYLTAPAVATVLSLGVGVAWFLWHSRVRLCGFHNLQGEADFPATTALVVLIAPVLALTAFLAGVMAGVAIGIAELAFAASRHCFE